MGKKYLFRYIKKCLTAIPMFPDIHLQILLLNMDNVNLYDISQSLGHKKITITQNYIQSGFNNKKIDYLNKDLDKKHRQKY